MKPNRRAFLLAGAVAAVAAPFAAKTVTTVADAKTKPARSGYQLTAHVRNYYRSTSI